MRNFMAVLGILALSATAAPVSRAATEGAAPAPWSPTADELEVYQMLSMRDGTPDCATVEASVQDPVPVLVSVAEHATLPPAVGVRAAHCLTTRHASEAKATLLSWVVDPARRGFAILIADDLGDNLMFPYPVCTFRECVPQQKMTDGQVGVVMRYTGTK